MKRFLQGILLVFICWGQTSGQPKAIVEVHAGTELLHIVNYLAKVYRPAVDRSAYLTDIDKWFGSYRQHPAVALASHLKFNDFVDLGWCLEFPSLALHEPAGMGYMEQFHSRDTLIIYLRLCRQFAKDTRFWQFYQQHKPQYQEWANQFEAALKREKPLEKLADFYQIPLPKTLHFSISPIGVVLRANVQSEIINPKYGHLAPVIIPFDQRYIDDKSTPTDSTEPSFRYNHTINNNVWHEASHIYWEELNKPFRKEIDKLSYSDSLSRQFTSLNNDRLNFYFFLHEVMADGVAIFLKKVYSDKDSYLTHLQLNEQAGGALFPKLITLLDQKYWQSRQEKNFQKFTPDILTMIRQASMEKQ